MNKIFASALMAVAMLASETLPNIALSLIHI